MDLFVGVEGNKSEQDFFAKNSGPGKLYSGGPKCIFNEKMDTISLFVFEIILSLKAIVCFSLSIFESHLALFLLQFTFKEITYDIDSLSSW